MSAQSIIVLGAGSSGIAAAQLARRLGYHVQLLDKHFTPEMLERLSAASITPIVQSETAAPNYAALSKDTPLNAIITSPGFALEHPWIRAAQATTLPLLSELEFASRTWQGELIAVTGSKGKSSVVKCLTDTLNLAGKTAVTAGNYGIPLAQRVLEAPQCGKGIIAVTEVSSFQMEHTTTFSPHIAALLNLQADHLDRHHSMKNYAALKLRLIQTTHPERGGLALLPYDLDLAPYSLKAPHSAQTFGADKHADWHWQGNTLFGPNNRTIPLEGYFANPILANAACCIAAILTAWGLTPGIIAQGLRSFVPLAHRMQRLATIHGITYIDDSKATTLTATEAACKMLNTPIRLIVGGLLKESDLSFILPTLIPRVAKAYIIGKDTTPFVNAWQGKLPLADCGTMAEAMTRIQKEAHPGETVLLSPGTASFDQYSGMAARGDDFRAHIPPA